MAVGRYPRARRHARPASGTGHARGLPYARGPGVRRCRNARLPLLLLLPVLLVVVQVVLPLLVLMLFVLLLVLLMVVMLLVLLLLVVVLLVLLLLVLLLSAPPGLSWGPFGALLKVFGSSWGSFCGVLGPSWGVSQGPSGASWGSLGEHRSKDGGLLISASPQEASESLLGALSVFGLFGGIPWSSWGPF